MTNALVLGAGGTVGMAYHAGALRAVETVGGFAPNDASLVVGTSAGSMMGALLRSGRTTEELFLGGLGENDELRLDSDDTGSQWEQAWRTPFDLVRRVFGSMYVLQRSMIRVPTPRLPHGLRNLFPGGFFTIADAETRLADIMPMSWPTKPLWLVTVDVRTGRRVILGRRNPPRADLHAAVLASCAIPGFFQPIRVNGRTLVDGGVHSPTNLDLAMKIKPSVAIVIAPMGYDAAEPPGVVQRVFRDATQERALRSEVAGARSRNARVLQIRPGASELAAFGGNMMRSDGNEEVVRIAFESTAAKLDSPRARDLLAEFRESTDSTPPVAVADGR